jgi:UDP-N-acetylglucosamine--N-acetylmuramyl-(pentapeptide) pyrophosphoryl-undecaprenol N-acetylglucosamine transferase
MSRAYVFGGGGTGGHLFPGIAIAEKVLKLEAASSGMRPRIVFLCSDRAIDAGILGAARLGNEPIDFQPTRAAPFVVSPKGMVRFLRGWGPTVRQSRGVIRAMRGGDERHEVRVVALGGFVAAPVVQAARVERARVTMLNLDAVPGLANRWISRRADEVFTSAEVSDPIGTGWTRIAPIVRGAAVAPGEPGTPESMARCRREMGLDPSLRTLLVTGASQGARSINRLMEAFVVSEGAALAGWQVLHQTGKDEVERTREMYKAAGVPARVESFIASMGLAWGGADLAISRAGAGSVGEAWANRVPSILMPYPYHKDQHQRVNAVPLERAGGAIVVEDLIEPGPNMGVAGARLRELLTDGARHEAMRRGLLGLGPADGAERVARALVSS